MHPEYDALQAQITAANNILRHVAEHLALSHSDTSLERLRGEVYGYFGMPYDGALLARQLEIARCRAQLGMVLMLQRAPMDSATANNFQSTQAWLETELAALEAANG